MSPGLRRLAATQPFQVLRVLASPDTAPAS